MVYSYAVVFNRCLHAGAGSRQVSVSQATCLHFDSVEHRGFFMKLSSSAPSPLGVDSATAGLGSQSG